MAASKKSKLHERMPEQGLEESYVGNGDFKIPPSILRDFILADAQYEGRAAFWKPEAFETLRRLRTESPATYHQLLDDARTFGIDARRVEAALDIHEHQEMEAITTCLEDVEEHEHEWLWHPYIPIGGCTMLDGDPGVGKSLLTITIGSCISVGGKFPDNVGKFTGDPIPARNVLLITSEDDIAATIRRRVRESEGNPGRIFVLEGYLDRDSNKHYFSLEHIGILDQALEKFSPLLVVLDPIQAYVGKIDMNRANDVRPLMQALNDRAQHYHCAIVMVRHPAKPGQSLRQALHRGLGSIDFIAGARSGLFCEPHPYHQRSAVMLCHFKINIAGHGRTQIYSKRKGVFRWEGVTRLTHNDLLGSDSGPNPRQRLQAALWLEQSLPIGRAYPANDIIEQGEQEGFSEKALRAAKALLHIHSVRNNDRWDWLLPPLEEDDDDPF